MISRRSFVIGTAASAGGLAGAGLQKTFDEKLISDSPELLLSPHGAHQNGIELELQKHTQVLAFNIEANTDAAAMLRWMGLLTDDIERLTLNLPSLGDPTPELAFGVDRLTVTLGFGKSIFQKLGLQAKLPEQFAEIPPLKIDRLEDRYCSTDVLIQVSSDNQVTLNHATRTLIRDSTGFANLEWVQSGFSNGRVSGSQNIKQRNLMGQVDGTDNPRLYSQDFANQVWITNGPAWLIGGTQVVIRRIRMNLDTWDSLGREQKERVIGRNLENGAPLGKSHEFDAPDFDAEDALGLKKIPEYAHIRNAAAQNLEERFFRRPFNYETSNGNGEVESGMVWIAYAKNLATQYLPVQLRLAESDLLNLWTTPVGSAVYLVPRGFKKGETLAADLFN